ncbi:uncharacterized protein LOC135832191 [Planococcus citri]|uniref:uncharacterized protein LOC135832191 n=1 Tax=Planococcus citri TaxID=170843 RepID=UPI0031FA4113
MVSASEGMIYYCTVFLTALVFLTEASAITTNYEKSPAQNNKTNESHEISPHRTKLTPARGRSSLSKNQNQDRVNPLVLSKLKSTQKIEPITDVKLEPELLVPKNSGGENDIKDKGGGNTDDDDKTLSEQVADGKYGLIQHEIFTEKPQRPGIISYDINPEVPKDSVNNLGGLEPEDIWLAENHLLVLAGGGFNTGMQTQWKPIDNYIAPKRPVKLSVNPKVPPPFPVQLSENGPIEFLKPMNGVGGAPGLSFVPFFNPLSTPLAGIGGNKTQSFPQPLYGKLPNFAQYGPPGVPQLKPGSFPPAQPPSLAKPPPGSEFIPPYLGSNITDAIDEDDPSLYYPPPYDFFYPVDNSSKVPPGPLVPGIVLPPPPDFFTLLTNKTAKSQNFPATRPKPLYKPTYPYKSAKQLTYPQFNDEDLAPKVKPVPSTEKPKEQTTFINYDDIINEVTYPDAKHDKITYSDIKVNKVGTDEIDDWIPIPAPKPFYITGARKPSQNTLLVMMDPPYAGRAPKTGYAYDRPGNPLKIVTIDQSKIEPTTKRTKIKFSNYLDRFPSDEEFRSTTPVTPLVPTARRPPKTEYYTSTSAPPAASVFNTPGHTAGVDTIKATYYFYEEPEFPKTKTPAITNTGYTSQPFSTTTPLPIKNYNNDFNSNAAAVAAIKSELPEKPQLQVVNHESKRKPITPMIPIYYLAELENIVDLIKPMNLPYQSNKNAYYTTTSKPTYSVGKPNYDRPTPRPIFEYSYVASDYSGPTNQLAQSTPQPYQDPYPSHFNYNPYYPQQPYQPIYNPIDYSKPIQTTIAPLLNSIFSDKPLFSSNGAQYQFPQHGQKATNDYDSFDRPWVPNTQYSQLSYPTDNPYYAFFTKEEEDLIDENTKKYFTIFGQKIRNVDSTTPIPIQTASSTTTTRWNHDRDRDRDRGRDRDRQSTVKYSKPSTQASQPITSNYLNRPNNYGLNYYTSTVPYTPEYTTVKSRYQHPNSVSSTSTAAAVASTTSHQTNVGAPAESQKLPISLEGDTLVNYVTPLAQDPDAEYITPKLSKQHIRPIVVEDLPPDVNERLKNLMNSPKYLDRFKPKQVIPSSSTNRYRYLLIDDQRQQQQQEQHETNNDKDPYENFDYQQPYQNTELTQSSTPISLESDILVNYQGSKLPINPNAEYIDSPSSTQKLREKEDESYPIGDQSSQKPKSISLHNDILVNYQNKEQLTINPEAEYIDTNDNEKTTSNNAAAAAAAGATNTNNAVSYKYPAVEHGHFYFLTPQETHLTQLENESYNFQSDVEKPGGYFKRKPRKDQSIENTTVKSR